MEKATPGVVEADHIPPKDSVNKLRESFKNNPRLKKSLREQHPALYDLVMSNDRRGRELICMNTLYSDHQRALTSRNSFESQACRDLLTKTLASGDMEKVLKLSLISAHPESSERIRNSLGIQRNFGTDNSGLKTADRNNYYQEGFNSVVGEYSRRRLIKQNQTDPLRKWVEEKGYMDTTSPEYQEIVTALKKANRRNFQHNEL